MSRRRMLRPISALLASGVLFGCPEVSDPADPTHPAPGDTAFLSADGYAGQESPDSNAGTDDAERPASPGDDGSGSGERTVEEGDIYRVLSGSLIANLNAYRGLQLIDFADPASPRIVGRYAATGSPVEMYVHEGIAYVLLNDWRGYYGSRFVSELDVWQGGVALAIDVRDPARPVLLDRAVIPGYIQKSRLVHGEGHAALYVVTGGYDSWEDEDGSWRWETRTVVQSFDVSDETLVPRTQLNLGGYVADIQATPDALLVARNDWHVSESQSQVSIVDISDPTGVMVEGDEIGVEGWVESQFNLDLYNGVLRVVSGSRWGSDETNHLQTFDATDIHNLVPIDHETFGDGMNLYATLFLGNKAFFVTYLRVDPFHAFEIDDEGFADEKSEFIVSGWNDFFRAVYDTDRLIGIGVNDEEGQTLAVSLYDITDLENPRPLLDREEVEADSSWSEANFDHRAFSILEGAVDIAAGDVRETGLVLLPFSGWSDDYETYTAGVQVFTFSETTLTRRGLMVHGTPVRRSFFADEHLTANLSEAELSLFDTADPAAPQQLGRLELAPNYTEILPLGDDHALRVKDSRDSYGYWWGSNAELPPSSVEVIRRDGDPDAATPIARLDIPANASVHLAGDRLVSIDMRPIETDEWPYTYESDVVVYDLSDPTTPIETARLTTDRLQPSWGWGWNDCFDCYWGYGGGELEEVFPAGEALAFVQRHPEQQLVGRERTCDTYAYSDEECRDETSTCTFYSGGIRCTSTDGGPEHCSGSLQRCTYDLEEGSYECQDVDSSSVATRESCYEWDRYRYWNRFTVEVLDLRDASSPAFASRVELPPHREGITALADGDGLWLASREPVQVEGDPRPYLRYFAQRLALTDPAAPAVGPAINVPGTLISVEGAQLFTRDLLWGEDVAETWVHRVRRQGSGAVLEASRRFTDRDVYDVRVDGAGHLLVTHRDRHEHSVSSGGGGVVASDSDSAIHSDGGLGEPTRVYQKLSVLDGRGASLSTLSEIDVDTWATLRDARAGRALFQVPGGLLVMNLDDAAQPYPQAYFTTRGWPRDIVIDGREVLFAAGRYGVYGFDIDAFNLLEDNPL